MNNAIRIRACVAYIQKSKILLIPHFNTDKGPVQWNLPGGAVEFGETIRTAAAREFKEETGLEAEIGDVVDVSEVLLPDQQYHSITITFQAIRAAGCLRSEPHNAYGEKNPRWVSADELKHIAYHPKVTIDKIISVCRASEIDKL